MSKGKTFGQTIGDRRRELGISVTSLALQLVKEDGEPITYQYLTDLEKDRRHPPSDFLMEQLASKLDLPVLFLYAKARRFPPAFNNNDDKFTEKLFEFLSKELKGPKAA